MEIKRSSEIFTKKSRRVMKYLRHLHWQGSSTAVFCKKELILRRKPVNYLLK